MCARQGARLTGGSPEAARDSIADQPPGDQKSLEYPDQGYQIIGGGVFCDGYLHGQGKPLGFLRGIGG